MKREEISAKHSTKHRHCHEQLHTSLAGFNQSSKHYYFYSATKRSPESW